MRFKGLFILLAVFVFSRFYFLKMPANLWWDSAVYIEMGEYIAHFGNAGLWEASRPLVLPLLLALFSGSVLWATLLAMVFSIGAVYFTYKIGETVFDEKTALLAAVFLAFSPAFFQFSAVPLTTLPSIFFSLWGIYAFLKKRWFMAGLLLGMAFMTRFLQLVVFAVLLLVLLFKRYPLAKIRFLMAGFSVPVLLYLLTNFFLYSDPFYPFTLQLFLTRFTGWVYIQPFYFYLVRLFVENYLWLFAAFAALLALRKPDAFTHLLLSLVAGFLLFFSVLSHKETRFLLTFLPYLYLLAAFGAVRFFAALRSRTTRLFLLIVLLGVWGVQAFSQYAPDRNTMDDSFAPYLAGAEGVVWVSSPFYSLFTEKRVETIYYPTFDSRHILELMERIPEADYLFFNACDVPCSPSDASCEGLKEQFISIFSHQKIRLYGEEGICNRYVFVSNSASLS